MSLLLRAKKIEGKFQNPAPTVMAGFSMAFKVLPLYLKNREESTPRNAIGPFHTDSLIYASEPHTGMRLTWFGHSSVLLEIDGFRVLMDPIWEKGAGPFGVFGPKRFFAPTMRLEDLPPLDVVLVSHDHYDHFGAKTLKRLNELPQTLGARWVTSLGVDQRLQKLGVPTERITALNWTETVELGHGEHKLRVTSWPARHFSGRGLGDRFKTLWGSFVLEGEKHRVYFGADSGYWDGFAEIGAQYDRFDLVMLEIGAFHPLWSAIHLGPDNAAKAFADMGGSAKCGVLFPIHWGLFNLALHAWRQPIEELLSLEDGKDLRLWLPKPGVPTDFDAENPSRELWWKQY
ncbi:MBL fold metallo-hydrolase [Granulicella cerasi]|uniref:MBL fold metallo-hydrolase n=1 Tax=Granulicella cerasi TaxID=741063 RepID=A0ABW1Z6E4_9BACT|nr:MBL fold metallo-hydrolase [Granulicella cerasi]